MRRYADIESDASLHRDGRLGYGMHLEHGSLSAVLLLFVLPVGILVHELAHGVVALRLTDGPVHVLVGRLPSKCRLTIGRLHLSPHIVPEQGAARRGVVTAGRCVYRRTGTPRDDAMIAAAGPIASIVWACICTAALAIWGTQLDFLVRGALLIGIVEAVIECVYNGAALALPGLMVSRPDSDGARVRRALAAERALDKIEGRLGRPPTELELRQIVATKRPPSALHDQRISTPPPSDPSAT
jgi:hypothetical protein